MNSTPQETATPAAEPTDQRARRRVTDYDRLVDDLAYTYEGIFSRDSICPSRRHCSRGLGTQGLSADSGFPLRPRAARRRRPSRRAVDQTASRAAVCLCSMDVADPADQPIERIRDIRDDLQARVTALLRHLNI